MNISRCFCKETLKPRSLTYIRRHFNTTSAQFEASSNTSQPQIKEEKFDFEDLKVLERSQNKKPPINPFMKDVFLSVFNKELLAFPEILNKDDMQDLDRRVAKIESILNDVEKTDVEKISSFKNTGIYGAPLNLTAGGLALNCTERIRYLETISPKTNLCKTLSDHWVGLSTLSKGLEIEKFNQISNDLISGNIPITMCIREDYSDNINKTDLRTAATLHGNNIWYIDGEKYCRNSDGYMVALCTVEENRVKPFLVHPKAKGVSIENGRVKFLNTPVTPLDITDDALNGQLSMSRLDSAVAGYGLLRHLLLDVARHIRGKFVSGEPMADLPLLRSRAANALLHSYTVESMCYFTAGLIDGYEQADYDLEAALCRLYTFEYGLEAVVELLDALGMDALDGGWGAYLEDMRYLSVQDDYQNTLHIYSALLGVRHAGMQMADEIKQMRNPLFHPSIIVKKMFANRHQENDSPKLTLFLEEQLHPSLKQSAQNLEYSVLRMRYASELLLSRHGADICSKHTDLKRLSQAACEIYAMTAVLARASRSYCIGVRNSDVEMKLAATIVELKKQSVSRLVRQIDDGEYLNLDHFKLDFGKKVFDTCTTLVQPATERVFW